MRLHLIRHGKAEDEGPDGSDASRRLTEQGRAEWARAAEGLARLDVRPDVILTSPLPRARETAEILARALGGPAPTLWTEAAPGGPYDEAGLLGQLARHGDEVVLVGHEPTLGLLVSIATFGHATAATPLKKGGVACIHFVGAPAPGQGRLVWFLPPRLLRQIR